MGFFRQEYWSGLPLPSLGDLPNLGIKPGSPTLQADALPSEPISSHFFSKRFLLTKIPFSHTVAQTVKNLPTMWETWVQSLGREGLLEKEMATHSSILAWRIPGMGETGGLLSMGSHRVGHD